MSADVGASFSAEWDQDWQQGEVVMIVTSVSNDEAKLLTPQGAQP
jgi:hypothetical protein